MNGLIQSEKQIKKINEARAMQKKQDEFFMRKALMQAKVALSKGEVPVGAVIVKDGKIIARAYNKKEGANCAVCHAEIISIERASKKLGWRLKGCTMYVTVEPCAMCAGAIASARIDRLCYGAKENKSGFVDSNFDILKGSGLNHSTEHEGGVLEEECLEILTVFFQNRRG